MSDRPTAEHEFTRRPFTVAVCGGCDRDPALMSQLRAVVKRCTHGVLVETHCLLGKFACTTLAPMRGAILLLQPCNFERVPIASVQWIGPVRTDLDAQLACAWIAAGVWDGQLLPRHLRAELNVAALARNN
ncbi:hypothetical protein [Mycobacterium sp. SMC-4]|uniref:hypothetical protein n=1 Tax=Mycobacterium sp. SMC-4 TaxID=2857059 RepID=UPI0021B21AAE|nr:hypothetical protein [Mycobacterium sp. SMC-4]